ncbi:MAG: queuosine precursor transporter [Cyclobacteriaceae bacterium]|nr:queuosine precursor transporter [Cyclobacteriaceae bacterium]MCH8516409.1 queuosine precursor transporter [Cyclobacteriaceae bacterium]
MLNTSKKTRLFVVLGAIFFTNAIIAEFIGVKVFSLEKSMGIMPAELLMPGGDRLSFNLTAGVILWPVIFVLSDIINEYFGKKAVRLLSFLAAGMITYALVMVYLATLLAPADFWLEVNATDAQGEAFDINYAFSTIFRQGMGIIAGSLTAFLLGQLFNVAIFQKIRAVTGEKNIWIRATGSTILSQLVDSFVVLFIAFYIFGDWSMSQIISVASINYIYKVIAAFILIPALYMAHFLIDNYLGKTTAKEMTEEAAAKSQGFF